MNDSKIIHADVSPDGGYTLTIEDMPGCHAEGDDLTEGLRNLAAAAALWSDDLLQIMAATTDCRLTLRTSRHEPGGVREEITCWLEPTDQIDDPAQLRSLTLVSAGLQATVTHLSAEALTQLGLWLINAAADAAAKR